MTRKGVTFLTKKDFDIKSLITILKEQFKLIEKNEDQKILKQILTLLEKNNSTSLSPQEVHFLESNKQVNVVVKKSAIHSGQFRTRGVEVLAGEDRKDTTHLESGVRLYLHLEISYFSARLGSERLRIAKLVKKGERVLVMFSGSAPYPLVLAKHTQASKIVGIELNPDAHAFAVKNREKNKVSSDRVELINGDVQVEVPRLIAHGEEKEGGFTKFDRVLMPLPKTSEEFLGDALPVVRPGGMIHLYAFLNEKEIDDEGKRIVNLCEEMGFTLKLDKVVKCGQHAPYTFRVCYDLIVS